jgi:hypothetical protein
MSENEKTVNKLISPIKISNRYTQNEELLKRMFMYSSNVIIIIVYIKMKCAYQRKKHWFRSQGNLSTEQFDKYIICLSLISMSNNEGKKNLFSPADGACYLSCIADMFFLQTHILFWKKNVTEHSTHIC